jgi:Outer membrane protein beta-barrel domain
MRHIILFLGFAFVFSFAVNAQQNFIISYPISFPTGAHSDYISATSFRGFSTEYVQTVKENLSVGLELGWHVFYQEENEKEYKEGTISITGRQYRYTNAVPILAQAKWLLPSNSDATNFYVGLGIGTLYVDRSTDFGLYRIKNDAWQFLLRPEAGVAFKLQPGTRLFAGVKYYSAFNTDDLDGQSFLSANIGFIFSSGTK